MGRFVEGADKSQLTLLPECLEDWVSEDNAVYVIDAFVEALDLHGTGFERVIAKETGRPSYHPAVLLKLYIYGYLNRVQSSRRLEREACRNVEVMWLIGRLAPDHKTIADFRKDNGAAIRKVCAKSLRYAGKWACCRPRASRLMAGTATSHMPRWRGEWRRSRKASVDICVNSIAPIGRSLRKAIIIKTTRIKEKIA
jgi:transposase